MSCEKWACKTGHYLPIYIPRSPLLSQVSPLHFYTDLISTVNNAKLAQKGPSSTNESIFGLHARIARTSVYTPHKPAKLWDYPIGIQYDYRRCLAVLIIIPSYSLIFSFRPKYGLLSPSSRQRATGAAGYSA